LNCKLGQIYMIAIPQFHNLLKFFSKLGRRQVSLTSGFLEDEVENNNQDRNGYISFFPHSLLLP
jgi:hypothetical protein